MPCNTIQTASVELNHVKNIAALGTALAGMGYQITKQNATQIDFYGYGGVRGSYADGQLTYRGTVDVNAIKRAYSCQIVEANAKKFGWIIKKTNANKYQVGKRF